MTVIRQRLRAVVTVLVATTVAAGFLAACGGTPKAGNCGGGTYHGIRVPTSDDSATVSAICSAGGLKSGVAVAFPQLIQDPKSGKYKGPAIFLAEQIAAGLHVKSSYVNSDFATIVGGLQSRKFQLIVAPLLKTPERSKVVDFVNYTESGTCYAIPKGNTTINSVTDLNSPSVKILTYTGTGNEQAIMRAYPKAKTLSLQEPPGGQLSGLRLVKQGRADVAPIDSTVALVAAQRYPDFRIIPGGAKKCLEKPEDRKSVV